jgi:S-adenosylmethionine:tRNA ribosyltransferase-isomerase
MRVSEIDYELPRELIAQYPVERRDSSRLMVLDRASGSIEHRRFAELPQWLRAGDVLVRNVSRVVPARMVGRRELTGGKWEGLYLRSHADGGWEILAKSGGHPRVGERIIVEACVDTTETGVLVLRERLDDGRWRVAPEPAVDATRFLDRYGHIPLPPYIRGGRGEASDRVRYQTVYAADPGSVAAPTAGLHFTPELIDELERLGVRFADVTLHVGLGTFKPIAVDEIDDHVLDCEWIEMTEATAAALRDASRGRTVAIGTTACRVLETVAASGSMRAYRGETSLYIKPGHRFEAVDALVTNFHLPRSSLLVLVAAFAGMELTRRAYEIAVRERYRFYSYGDAMLII